MSPRLVTTQCDPQKSALPPQVNGQAERKRSDDDGTTVTVIRNARAVIEGVTATHAMTHLIRR